MKFIHTADIHWGMVPDSEKPWSRERTQAIRDTFGQIVEKAREEAADFLLISGDLFHRQPLARDLKEINYLFSTIPTVRVLLTAGNHDRIRPSSALYSFHWCSNVTCFLESRMESVYFADCNVEIHGFSYHAAEDKDPHAEILSVPKDGRIHILMLHGGDASHIPFDRQALLGAGYAYVALGHIHKPEIFAGNRMAYPGSPEPLDKTETGEHGILAGELDPASGKVTSLKLIPMSRSRYIPLAVNISVSTTNAELEQKIAREIEKRGKNHIYRFRIKGMRDPDIRFDYQELMNRYRIIEILDESEPQYDFSALYAEHAGDMIGFYIRALQGPDRSPVEKKALFYGIHALLLTQDERN